jgi:hypothetical protein
VCMCLFCVCVVLCLGRGLATSWSLAQGVLPSVKWSWNWKQWAGPEGGVEPVEKEYPLDRSLGGPRAALDAVENRLSHCRHSFPAATFFARTA